MLIYYAKNLVTNKIYIGKTTLTVEKRKKVHYRDSKKNYVNRKFYDALNEYPAETWEWGIIKDCIESNDILNEQEIFWIKHHDSFNNGYNATEGGDGGKTYDQTGRKLSPESIDKMRNSLKKYYETNETWNKGKTFKDDKRIKRLKKEKNGMYGKTHSEETKSKMSDGHKGQVPWNTGKHLHESTKKKLSKALQGRFVSSETRVKKVLNRFETTIEVLIDIKNEFKYIDSKNFEYKIIDLHRKYSNIDLSFLRNFKRSRIYHLIPEKNP